MGELAMGGISCMVGVKLVANCVSLCTVRPVYASARQNINSVCVFDGCL